MKDRRLRNYYRPKETKENDNKMQHVILDWVLETDTHIYTDTNLLGQLTTFEWEARRYYCLHINFLI